MRIILPKTFARHDPDYGPLFFLMGPNLGGSDWQFAACMQLSRHFERFYAAIPYRVGVDHPLAGFIVGGDDPDFPRQLEWERHYLALAAHRGCIIAWLPEESKTAPRTDGLPYAMDTRGEIGEWRGRMIYDRSIRYVVGGEREFPGLDVIDRNNKSALGPDFPMHVTLEATIAAAAVMVKQRM